MKLSVRFFALAIAFTGVLQAQQVWTLYGPQSRHSHTAVYDPTTTKMIVFGGVATSTNSDLNDVWIGATSTNQDDSFTQLLPSGTAPQGRYGQVATYDSGSNRMMIFGGALGSPAPCANDFWILDRANGNGGTPDWIAESASGTLPAARAYAGAAYDPSSNSMMVFGGTNCSGQYMNDIWVLSSANGEGGTPRWTQLTTSGTPPAARESASVIYDQSTNVLTVYGGDAGSSPFGDVWVLSNANGNGGTAVWTQLHPTGTAPTARTGQTGNYDATNHRMIISGGINGTLTLTDTWILTSANGVGAPSWILLAVQGTAPSIAYHSATYNPSANGLYTFAGKSSTDKLQTNSHAFALGGANGLAKTAPKWILGGPAVRYGHSSFYDSPSNSLFVYAGQHSVGNLNFSDYWQATGVIGATNLKWTVVKTTGPLPSARYGHTGLYDSGSNRMMVFGGSSAGACLNDYHVLQNANLKGGSPTWLTVTPTGTVPAARALHASAYDSTSNTVMIFGGWNCGTGYFNDVWVLTNANDVTTLPSWRQLSTAGIPPSARESSSMIYDPASNSLIVFGGDSGKTLFGDLWLLSNANGTGGTPTWTQMSPLNNGPSARSGQTAIYDASNNIMTLYGGFSGTKVLSDVWFLSSANGQGGTQSWTQGVSGLPRRLHTSVYDPSSNEMITFGGSSGTSPAVPSSDIYTFTDANGLH